MPTDRAIFAEVFASFDARRAEVKKELEKLEAAQFDFLLELEELDAAEAALRANVASKAPVKPVLTIVPTVAKPKSYRAHKALTTADDVLALLAESKSPTGLTRADISKALNADGRSVGAHLRALKRAGKVNEVKGMFKADSILANWTAPRCKEVLTAAK